MQLRRMRAGAGSTTAVAAGSHQAVAPTGCQGEIAGPDCGESPRTTQAAVWSDIGRVGNPLRSVYGNGYWLMMQKQNSSNLPSSSICIRSTMWLWPP